MTKRVRVAVIVLVTAAVAASAIGIGVLVVVRRVRTGEWAVPSKNDKEAAHKR